MSVLVQPPQTSRRHVSKQSARTIGRKLNRPKRGLGGVSRTVAFQGPPQVQRPSTGRRDSTQWASAGTCAAMLLLCESLYKCAYRAATCQSDRVGRYHHCVSGARLWSGSASLGGAVATLGRRVAARCTCLVGGQLYGCVLSSACVRAREARGAGIQGRGCLLDRPIRQPVYTQQHQRPKCMAVAR